MGIRAGDIRHFTAKGKELDIKGEDANVNFDLGGYTTEMGINGNGTRHKTQRRKKSLIGDLPVSIDDDRGDLEFLQAIANSGESVPVTIELASGVKYGASMDLTGEIRKASGDGIATITWEGDKLEKQ